MANGKKKKILKLLLLRNILRKRTRRYWVHPIFRQRSIDGEHVKLDEMSHKYPQRFYAYTRMYPETFTKLLGLVGSSLSKKNTNWREAIPSRIRLYVILRYLATGDSLRTIATSFSLGYATVWNVIRKDLPGIWSMLKGNYVKCPSTEEWGKIADEFYDKWNLPNCVGAIDGKHVVMEAPPNSGSLYFNYKGTFSVVLLATCDANYNFTTIDVGGYGKQSDGGIFAGSTLGKKLSAGTLNLCPPRKLPGTETTLPCFFVGDEAFPLTTSLMRPFPGKDMADIKKRIFNYRLSRARRCIENAFGILAARWRIFRRPIAAEPKMVEFIVLVCVALHNFVKKEETEDSQQRHYNHLDFGVDTIENVETGLMSGRPISIAAQERASKQMRMELATYLSTEGAVEWQLSKVLNSE